MKRKIVLGAILAMLAAVPLQVNAQESMAKIGEGYTSDHVYYEVFAVENPGESSETLYGTGVRVTRRVCFSGSVEVPKEYYWRENIDGTFYSGTLTLQSATSDSVQTIATYTGTLYKE